MTHATLLKQLQELWSADGKTNRAVDFYDLLDDLATIGVAGASETYLKTLTKESKRGKHIAGK